jgi:Tfp pilus assembly protein PilZ
MKPLRKLRVLYPTRRSALACFRAEGSRLSLFVPTNETANVDELIELAVTFGDCPDKFELKGIVRWQRAEARGFGQDAGLGVGFEGPLKMPLAAMVASCAGRPLESGTANKDRFVVQIPCRLRAGELSLTGEVHDVSESGIYVTARVPSRIKPGVELQVQLEPQWLGLLGDWITVKVVWTGPKMGKLGFGARFAGPSADYLKTIRKYLPTN